MLSCCARRRWPDLRLHLLTRPIKGGQAILLLHAPQILHIR